MKRHLIPLAIFLTVYSVHADSEWQFEACAIPAPSLKDNRLGDATIQNIGVILPPSYFNSDKKLTPSSIHFMVGVTVSVGTGIWRCWKPTGKRRVPMNSFGCNCQEVNALHGSFYTNSPITGNWGDFIAEDVVGFVDSHYRTLDNRENRAITGHSMGGAGCLELAMTRPDVFSIAYAMSPGLMTPEDVLHWHVAEPELIAKMESIISDIRLSKPDKAVSSLLERLEKEDDWRAYFSFGYGMAYAGDPTKTVSVLRLWGRRLQWRESHERRHAKSLP